MKKYLAMLLTVVMVFSFAACGSGGNQENIKDALGLLTAVWDSYGDSDKFPVAGGDFTEENMVMDGPGRYGVGDASVLDAVFGLPEASAPKIDDAASLMHMMNANTFTCAAFHVTKSDDVKSVAESLKDQILKRQWMCGFPDKLVVITVDDYVISAFGAEDLIDTLKTKVAEVYKSAVVAYEENIA